MLTTGACCPASVRMFHLLYVTIRPFKHAIRRYLCNVINCGARVYGNIIDYMASTSGEFTVPTEPEAATRDEAQFFIDALGPDLGPAVYMHMIGLMAILDGAPAPILHPALTRHITSNNVDSAMVVAHNADTILIANNAAQARRFRRDLLLARYRETMQLGETILRAPQ